MFKYKFFVTNTVGVEVAANVYGLAEGLELKYDFSLNDAAFGKPMLCSDFE
jgi:hypothetical protein